MSCPISKKNTFLLHTLPCDFYSWSHENFAADVPLCKNFFFKSGKVICTP